MLGALFDEHTVVPQFPLAQRHGTPTSWRMAMRSRLTSSPSGNETTRSAVLK